MPDILSKENIDRLPVIVSASNVEKFLGVPALTSGTREKISLAVYNLLLDWNLVDKVQALCLIPQQVIVVVLMGHVFF